MSIFIITIELLSIAAPRFSRLIIHIWNEDFEAITRRDSLGVKGIPYAKFKRMKLNKYGFNDPDNYTLDKKNHSIRIICLGDSITMGSTLEYPYNNWPRFLEAILRAKGFDAEVINTAIPGNSYPQLINRLKQEYIYFKPDVVLIYRNYLPYFQVKRGRQPTAIAKWGKILQKSAFLRKYLKIERLTDKYQRLLLQRRKYGVLKLINDIPEEVLIEHRKNMELLIEVCKQNNITLVLSEFPCLINENNKSQFLDKMYSTLYFYPQVSVETFIKSIPMFNALTAKIAKENSVKYAVLSQGLKLNTEYFSDCYHLTKKGAWQVAQNYADVITKITFSKDAGISKIR